MKMKKYNTEIKIESVSDNDYPIMISYHYGRGMSPWELTIEDAARARPIILELILLLPSQELLIRWIRACPSQ